MVAEAKAKLVRAVRSTSAGRSLIDFRHRIQRFAGLLSRPSALSFALRRQEKVVAVRIRPTGSIWHIRPESSDVECLKQVFIEEQYRVPFVTKPSVIVDAGANIGAASVYFARKYPDAKIFALEPEDSNFHLLKLNCANFPNVIPIHGALWSKSERVAVTDPSVSKWAFTVREGQKTETGIDGITIQELMRRMEVSRIDVLKLDVEGAEKEIFDSGSTQWLDHVGVIVIELHDGFKAGCAQAFYSALHGRPFAQALRGENIVIQLNP